MYGKSFQRMYQGSMVGSGSHVFAVWGYCISCADPEDHTVDLNPSLLAAILGETQERVEQAIAYLTAPDPNSHCTDHEGRRMIHQGGFAYFLVTHERYREMKNNEELRAYFREAKRKSRESKDGQRQSKTVKDSQRMSLDPASASVSASSGDRGGGEGERTEPDSLPHTLPDSLQRLRACPELRNLTARQWQALRAAFATMEPGPESEAVLTMLTRLAAIEAKDGQIEKPGTWIKFKLNDLSMGKIGVDGKGKGRAGGGERPPTYEEQRRAELRIAAGYPA